MKTLVSTESLFQAYVLGRDESIGSEIVGDETFRRARLDIYHDAYRLRLAEVLTADYKVLKEYAGEEVFDAIAADYLAIHPSEFRNVRWFGGRLAGFLDGNERYSGQPVLAELARFEWTLGLAFDAPDDPVLQFEDLAAVQPEQWTGLKLAAHPSLQVVALRTNAVAIWNAIKESAGGIAPEQAAQSTAWAIWRKDYLPYFRSLAADEAWALDAMRSGSPFADVCAGMCQWVAEDAAAGRTAGMLRGWVDNGWISRAVTTPDRTV